MKRFPIHALLFGAAILINTPVSQAQTAAPVQDEVIYHVVQRSFYDSNGDKQGDLNGLREKIPYLKELGVTSVLLLPLYESAFYHNYFASDFEKIDPEFGTMQDYLALVKELHRNGMKLYLDMETQYVTDEHRWWRESIGTPGAPPSPYILYREDIPGEPSSMVYGLNALNGYNGITRRIATVDLLHPKTLEYNRKLFGYFTDPNGDGRFDDGADGFRLDHMMDKLDGKDQLDHLFERFWTPLISQLRQQNPKLTFAAEQADWAQFGQDYLTRAGVDRVFAFRIKFAIEKFDKKELARMVDTTAGLTPAGKQQILFLENHDTPRFASAVKKDAGKERAGAALNLLLGELPSVYYGQELGMVGTGGFGKYGASDANDIPQREAFEWTKSGRGAGMALWYEGSGPWWDSTNVKPDDGISLEEQRGDTASLWNYYRRLIRLRSQNPALVKGQTRSWDNDNDQVFTFARAIKNGQILMIAVNLSDRPQKASLLRPVDSRYRMRALFGPAEVLHVKRTLSFRLPPYGVQVVEVMK